MGGKEFDRIQPAKVDISQAASPIPNAVQRRPLPLPALLIGALLALAAGVFFLLPDYVARQHAAATQTMTPETSATAGSAQTTDATPPAPPIEAQPPATESPYARMVDEQQRQAAKKALDTLLMLQHELQERRAGDWAKPELEQASSLAAEGDAAYREGDHETAQTRYREATAILQATLDGIGTRLQDRLTRGSAALAAGDSAQATALFAEALAIDQENAAARHGLQRAATLDQVIELSARAAAADTAGDTVLAQQGYEQALALDGEYEPARKALDDLRSRITGQRYREHLSAGFAALARADNAGAAKEFRAALALHGTGTEAREGLQQAQFQLSQQRIAELLGSARQAAHAEDWVKARRDFDAALTIDATLGPAIEGSREAARRIALDEALTELEHTPDRLLEPGTRSRAGELLARAAAISDPGPRLKARLAAVRGLLRTYSTPLTLQLRSDGQTEVSVLRVGSYGTLVERTLELLPGNYVAVGRRNGFRDVRIEFRVRAGQTPAEVLVQCVEKV